MALCTVEQAVEKLLAGDICAIPTETVYGLAADANNDEAVRSIYRTKERPSNHPLIVHVAQQEGAWLEQLAVFARDIPAYVETLANTFWPGPLTLILPRKQGVANMATAGQETVGLRCPSHPVAQEILQACKAQGIDGLAAPSANPFGKLSPTTAEHVLQHFDNRVTVVDGSACDKGVESTILLCGADGAALLRPGSITLKQLQTAIPSVSIRVSSMENTNTPGSLPSHYQPKTKLRIMPTKALQDAIAILGKDAKNIGIYTRTPMDRLSKNMPRVAMSSNPAEAEQNLYADLHTLDQMRLKLLWVEMPPNGEEWAAINDRLNKAAAD